MCSLICLLIFAILQDFAYGQCVMFGEHPLRRNKVAEYRGPPLPLRNQSAQRILKEYCPDLFKGSPDVVTCCDASQLFQLKKHMSMLKPLTSRCPACYRNLRQLFCHLTCHPNQASFVEATSEPIDDLADSKESRIIQQIHMYIDESYGIGLYNSCRNVQFSSSNSLIISLLCGESQCTPQKLFHYMGVESQLGPFITYFVMVNETTRLSKNITRNKIFPLDVRVWPCNENMNDEYETAPACSCADCFESCAYTEENENSVPTKFKLFGISAIDLFVLSIYFVFLILFITSHLLSDRKSRKQNNSKVSSNTARTEMSRLEEEELLFNDDSVDVSQPNFVDQLGLRLQTLVSNFMIRLGCFCATYPVFIIVGWCFILAGLSYGIRFYNVTTDPVKLWSSENSQQRIAKRFFDVNFGPFYRIAQVIIKPKNKTKTTREFDSLTPYITLGPALNYEILVESMKLENEILSLKSTYNNQTVSLSDICFKPLEPDNNNCAIQSVSQYFQNNFENLNLNEPRIYDFASHLDECFRSPVNTKVVPSKLSCVSSFGVPIQPYAVLGGIRDNKFLEAEVSIITIIIRNAMDGPLLEKALVWEKAFLNFLHNYNSSLIDISYRAERSNEDEIERESQSDVLTIAISYTVMFLYIAIALGITEWSNWRVALVKAKFSIAIIGVLITFLSVVGSVGFFSYLKVSTTLIVFEVVPFLVLAIGVDNIFILTKMKMNDRPQSNETNEQQIGRLLGRVGPAILLTGLTETIAFLMGALTNVPAVKMFSLYAAVALLLDFLLQLTFFVSVIALDGRRENAQRFDLCCCFASRNVNERRNDQFSSPGGSLMVKYKNFIFNRFVRPLIVLIFSTWACCSIIVMQKVPVGLDLKLTVPKNSYVLKFYQDMENYLTVGPPVYFILDKPLQFNSEKVQKAICGSAGSDTDSFMNQISYSALHPNKSRIAYGASSWLDDFREWADPLSDCCLLDDKGNFCSANNPNSSNCHSCNLPRNLSASDFKRYVIGFLSDNPGEKCPKGGRAAYKQAVHLNKNGDIGATYFMTYHTVLTKSEDYIDALRNALNLAANITKTLKKKNITANIFPYSAFYLFYEQYIQIWHDALFNISLSIVAIFVVSFVLLGFDLMTAIIIVLTIAMITVDLGGVMYLWRVELNALSLVNIVMSLGISVEFCAHIAREFAYCQKGNRVDRAKTALMNIGGSVLSGITLTKIAGICVLAFSHSQLFQVFYFRMYLCIMLIGSTHGLIFLPILLSYVGSSARLTSTMKSSRTNSKIQADKTPSATNQ